MEKIPNTELTENDIPLPEAKWGTIGGFALSFNGYEYWGSFHKCGDLANKWANAWREKRDLPSTLVDLRTCLFFEQRRWRHFGHEPDEETMVYIRALVEAIREQIKQGKR